MGAIGDKVGFSGVFSDEKADGIRLGASTVIYSLRAMAQAGATNEEMLGVLDDLEAAAKEWTNDSND